MNKKHLITFVVAIIATLGATAQQTVTPDPAVRHGVLPNGLTYFVRHNAWPEHRADFFIAQRVGSLQEQENQRGLAHFLEHMCFNGTRHFPGNSLIDYMESIGVKFGANLNAYTSTDQTVYNISNVPTDRRGALDSCFLVLADWGHDLTLDGKEIDKERGVIEGEWRQRTGANYRLLEKSGSTLYPGNLYGRRMPIGLMSVVKNFKHKELRDYYKKWYHPANQCIIVVGDIDPDYAVAKIHELFGKVKTPKKAPAVERVTVPANDRIIACVETDKEQNGISVRLLFKHGDLPQEQMWTDAYFEREYTKYAIAQMLNARFADLAQQPDAPFTAVRCADRNFMLASSQEAFQLIAQSKSGKAQQSMEWMAREVKRVLQHGFTLGELRRARLNYESATDKMWRERDRYTNTAYCRDYVRAYLDGEPYPSIEEQVGIMRRVTANVSLEQVNNAFASMATTGDRNVVLVTFAPTSEEGSLPTTAQLIDAYHNGMDQAVDAYEDNIASQRLLTAEPQPGKVLSEKHNDEFNATEWTLNNGMRVLAKKTDIKQGEVVIAGAGPGGLSQNYDAADAPSLKAINQVMALSGYGQFSGNELKKTLAGKDVKMRTFVSKTEEGFQGAAARADLETAMQLLHLKLTSPQKDENAFATFLANTRSRIEGQTDPKFEFADSIFANVYGHHPLGAERLSLDEVDRVDYDRILDIYRDRFADVSDLTVYIIGDFDTDTLRALTERYLASLPGNGRMEKPRDIGYHIFTGEITRHWTRAMETPQDKVYYFWNSPCPYNARNLLLAKVVGQVFSAIFREELREERGWTYHVDTHCSLVNDINGDDPSVIFMPLNVTITAGHGAEASDIIARIVDNVAKNGITEDQLLKVKKYLRKVYDEDLQDNTYWMAVMRNAVKSGVNTHDGYLDLLNGLTTDDVRRFIAAYIAPGNRLTMLMQPQQ